MTDETKRVLLTHFFSAYFHEDWKSDDDSAESVVAEYMRTAAPTDTHALGKAILEYSPQFASDKELEDKLFTELGCYYLPSGEGLSARIWVENLAKQLLKGNS